MPSSQLNRLVASIAAIQDRTTRSQEREKRLWRSFSDTVRRERKRLGWSLDQMGAKLGVGRSMLSYLETGGRDWTVELARKAAEVMASG